MKSLFLSAVLGLGILGGLLCSAAPAQAGPVFWFLAGRWTAVGPPVIYPYYGPPVYSYYYGPYPVPAPAPAEAAPTPAPAPAAPVPAPAASAPVPQTWSADYGPGETGRYQYYTSNGLQMCYDRQTGEHWYQDRNTREWKRWSR